jgi:uncharacterized membrane protein
VVKNKQNNRQYQWDIIIQPVIRIYRIKWAIPIIEIRIKIAIQRKKKIRKKYNSTIFFLSLTKLSVLNKKVIKKAIAKPIVSAKKEKFKSRFSNF